MNGRHPYLEAEETAGCAQADRFLARLVTGPCETNDLAQEIALARMGSVERQEAFCGRLQLALTEALRDA